MKKISSWLAVAGLFVTVKMSAISFNDVQFWTGSGTNRAALVIEWSAPEDLTSTGVPAPIADKSLVWGYRFNGPATGSQMLQAVLAGDPRLQVVADMNWGTFVIGINYQLTNSALPGITDGRATNFFTQNFITSLTVDIDTAASLNAGDLYWGGHYGPNWEVWTEAGAAGGFLSCPDRGTNLYWTADDQNNPYSGIHGQWELAGTGLDYMTLTNGSWVGFSVAAGFDDWNNFNSAAPYNAHKHAPIQPDPTITALVKNFSGTPQSGQWRAQFISCTNWNYALERSTDLQSWATVTNNIPGNGTSLNLADPAPPAGQAFYRVRAEQP